MPIQLTARCPTAPVVPPQLSHLPNARPTSGAEFLLDRIGPVEGTRVLLVGADNLELMCALIRRGCAAVAILRATDHVDAASADLVVVCAAASASLIGAPQADIFPEGIMRALASLGRLAVLLHPAAATGAAGRLDSALRRHGFMAVRAEAFPDGHTLFLAGRPVVAPLAWA